MNEKRFRIYMNAVDDELLEQAQRPRAKRRTLVPMLAAAACFCLILAGALIWRPWASGGTTADDLAEQGYTMQLPGGAADVTYALIDVGADYPAPMAEAKFELSGTLYTCRALRADEPAESAVAGAGSADELTWQDGSLGLTLGTMDGGTFVSWYDGEVQWCLLSDGGSEAVLTTARELLLNLGHDITRVPDGAQDISYNAFRLDGLTVAETAFTLGGARWSYRIAATGDVSEDFADISGESGSYASSAEGEVGWCPARLDFTDGGAGKICWFDVAPGLLYSLSVDTGASEQGLLDMASAICSPAQGDVG